MDNKYTVSGAACFIALPFWGWLFYSLYDYLAHEIRNPANYLVNLTGIIGIAGVLFLIIYGIVNLVKGRNLKRKTKSSSKK